MQSVTIKQLLSSDGGIFQDESAIVKIMGKIQEVNMQYEDTGILLLKVHDGTGCIGCYCEPIHQPLLVDTYYSFYVQVVDLNYSDFGSTIHLRLNGLHKINDYNEISYHLAETIQHHILRSQIKENT